MGSVERHVIPDDPDDGLSIGAWDRKDYPIYTDEFRLFRPYVDRQVADPMDISSRI